MKEYSTVKCRFCGEPIVLVDNIIPNEKKIPCDPGLIPYWWCKPKNAVHIVTQSGKIVPARIEGGRVCDIINVGYRLHSETCQGRKKR